MRVRYLKHTFFSIDKNLHLCNHYHRHRTFPLLPEFPAVPFILGLHPTSSPMQPFICPPPTVVCFVFCFLLHLLTCRRGACEMVHVWKPEDNFQESVLSSPHEGTRGLIQVARLNGKCLYRLSHLCGLLGFAFYCFYYFF